MPGAQELIGILIVVLLIWFVLKMARVAVRFIFFMIFLVLVVGAVYWVLVR
jgi:hypothetical protein